MQDGIKDAINNLITGGFLKQENNRYRLLQKGYDHLYQAADNTIIRPKKNWVQRNKKWFVGTVITVAIAIGGWIVDICGKNDEPFKIPSNQNLGQQSIFPNNKGNVSVAQYQGLDPNTLVGKYGESQKTLGQKEYELEKARWEKQQLENAVKSYENVLSDASARTIDAYKLAIKKEPHNSYACVDLCSLYIRLGRYTDAIDACKQAIEVDPRSTGAYDHLGFAYCKLARWQEAKEAFQQALKIDPNDSEAQGNLGGVYSQLGQYEDAIKSLKQAIRLRPDNAMVYNDLGWALGNQAKKENGAIRQQLLSQKEEMCLKAESIQRGSGAYGLACLAASSGDKSKCLKWLKIGEQENSLPNSKYAMAEVDLESVRNEDWFKEIKWSETQSENVPN
ncbi:MAG: hypothetical protein A2Y12_16605 [Planctomycetes bacterium GWF2_42_9]|nr:MAG: hypothetical protein A2Y12_16605 [Planctomycetes bacterium GWF2_42_9]